MQKWRYLLFFVLILSSCTNADDNIEQTLAIYVSNTTVEKGAVIACAASDVTTGDVLTFFYPEEGATNIRFYETEDTEVDHEDYANYKQIFINSAPFFNGHLGKFTQSYLVKNG